MHRLRVNAGFNDFEQLCIAGAESDELVWLLSGCEGLPGFTETRDLFGWRPEDLDKGLAAIEKAASVVEKIQHHPFGILASHADPVNAPNLDKHLRGYLELVRAAQQDSIHRSDWFLNIAKARLVIHVKHRTNGNVHDDKISGLIAAMTETDYNADAHTRDPYPERCARRGPGGNPNRLICPERVRG